MKAVQPKLNHEPGVLGEKLLKEKFWVERK